MNIREKIADVVYLNFASLAYNNWSGIPCGTDLKDAVFDIRKKNTKKLNGDTRHLYMVYSEDEKYEAPLWDEHFNGWRFLYAANRCKLAKDMFGFDLADNGFYAVAFINEETNNMIISFRGTDSLEDMTTDAWMGFFDKYSTQLTCVSWFVDYCKKLILEGPIDFGPVVPFIHFTGHSLGGGLAEYAHITECKMGVRSVTWNGLGMGARLRRKLDSSVMQMDAITDVLALLKVPNCAMVADRVISYIKPKLAGFMSGLDTEESLADSIREEVKNVLLNECTHFNKDLVNVVWRKDSRLFKNLRYEFGFLPSMKREDREKEIQDIIMKDAEEVIGEHYFKYVVEEIIAVIIGLTKFSMNWDSKGYEEHISGLVTELNNFIFSDDWTSIIHKRCGLTKEVDRSNDWHREPNEDMTKDDGKMRVLKETLDNFGFKKHGLGNFIMFMNDDGMIESCKIRPSILENVVRYLADPHRPILNKVLTDVEGEWTIPSDKVDVVTGLPTYISHGKKRNGFIHWDIYKKFLDFLTLESVDDKFVIGKYNNMIFDNICGYDVPLSIKIAR